MIAMIWPLIAFVNLLQGMGLSSAVANAREVTYSQLSTVFWINVGISTALCILIALSAPLASAFYGEPAIVGPMIAMGALTFIAGLQAQHTALIYRQMRFGANALIEAISSILALAAGICVALVWPGPWALVSSPITAALVSLAGTWWVTKWRPGRPSSLKDVAPFLKFGRGITGFQIANFVARNLDNVLIGRYAGAVQLGLYDRAYKLLMLPVQQSLGPISRVRSARSVAPCRRSCALSPGLHARCPADPSCHHSRRRLAARECRSCHPDLAGRAVDIERPDLPMARVLRAHSTAVGDNGLAFHESASDR